MIRKSRISTSNGLPLQWWAHTNTSLCLIPSTIQEEQNEANTQQRGFQQHKAERQKANASNRVAWNTLFMRADTVAEAVAAHYGISKSQLLDKEAAGAA